MFKKHLIPKLIAIVMAVVLIASLAVLAAGTGSSAGTTSDPLVTMSYVNETFRAELLQQLQQEMNTSQAEFSQSISAMLQSISNQYSGYAPEMSAQSPYVSITVPEGETLELAAGQQFLVLSGAGKVSLNMMVDTTAGVSLASGNALSENHFYTVPAESAITATSDLSILIQ